MTAENLEGKMSVLKLCPYESTAIPDKEQPRRISNIAGGHLSEPVHSDTLGLFDLQEAWCAGYRKGQEDLKKRIEEATHDR